MMSRRIAVSMAYATALLIPQYLEAQVKFDAVSIKRLSDLSKASGVRVDGQVFLSSGVPLRNMIYSAYGVPAWAISGGPGWLDTDAYEIRATIPANTPMSQINAMVQSMFAERFQLKVHREIRDFPVYALVVAKGGLKLKVSADDKFSVNRNRGQLEIHHVSMPALVQYLSATPAIDRPVVDRTEAKGYFNAVLSWRPEGGEINSDDSGASIYKAIEEQLGLRLEPTKAPSEFLIIDSIERPTEN